MEGGKGWVEGRKDREKGLDGGKDGGKEGWPEGTNRWKEGCSPPSG